MKRKAGETHWKRVEGLQMTSTERQANEVTGRQAGGRL